MGGLAAEEVFLGETSTGSSGDLAGATRLAAQMVGAYGMAGALVSLEASAGPADLVTKVLADEGSRRAAEELLENARNAARAVVTARRNVVEALRDALLEQDELVGPAITAVIEEAEARQRAGVIDVRDRSALREGPQGHL
jgi:cell division protease FtsH